MDGAYGRSVEGRDRLNSNVEIRNPKQIRSWEKGKMSKKYDLEDRTFAFARRVRVFVRSIPKDLGNIEDAKQLVKASGSVGANYIEANEALSKKDFIHRIKICRKEAKECRYWLRLIETNES